MWLRLQKVDKPPNINVEQSTWARWTAVQQRKRINDVRTQESNARRNAAAAEEAAKRRRVDEDAAAAAAEERAAAERMRDEDDEFAMAVDMPKAQVDAYLQRRSHHYGLPGLPVQEDLEFYPVDGGMMDTYVVGWLTCGLPSLCRQLNTVLHL